MNMMKTKDTSNDTPKYSYGCVMLDFESPLWKAKCETIDEEDLYTVEGDDSYGIETDCHVTILYGLHEEVVAEDVKPYLSPINQYGANIVSISLFENPKFDVLKYDVVCPQADITYQDLKQSLPNTQTFASYKPHMTIAYLKPGMGKKYLELIGEPIPIKPYTFSMSHPILEKTYFK